MLACRNEERVWWPNGFPDSFGVTTSYSKRLIDSLIALDQNDKPKKPRFFYTEQPSMQQHYS